MKKLKLTVFALSFALASTALFSCKKYEDGPGFSLASKKGRVANTWKTDAVYENGVQETLDAEDLTYRVTFEKDGSLKETHNHNGTSVSYAGTWTFDEEKENLSTIINYGFDTDTETYRILRLKSSEMWLEETDDNGNKTEIHLVKE